MKKVFKQVISVILCALIISCPLIPGVSASTYIRGDGNRATQVPTVYVQGYGSALYADSHDKNSQHLVGGSKDILTDGSLEGILDGIMAPLIEGIQTDDWTNYSNFLVEKLVSILSFMALDKNGEASNGSGNQCERDIYVTNRNNYNGKYDLYAYTHIYDWRIDPFISAAELNDYIKKVKTATGFDKVNIVGRCLGANIIMAYLSEYGYDDINAINLYVGGLDGFEFLGALFSGQVIIESDDLNNFLQYMIDDNGDPVISFVKSLVAILNFTKGLNIPIELVYKIYEEVYFEVIPRTLKETFGTMPAFWSMVGKDYYEAAMELNFHSDEDKTEYAKLIEKTDKYYNNVTLKTENILNGAIDEGVKVYITAKYGSVNIPLSDKAKYHSDGIISVDTQTLGATSAIMGSTFSSSYIKKAEENGTAGYISPDKTIDASTCFLPDHTWFIKGSSHGVMPYNIDVLQAQVFNASGYGDASAYVTVGTLPEFPQYLCMVSDDEYAPLVPLTEENSNIGDEWNVSIFDHFSNFFEKLFSFITELVYQLKNMIQSAITEVKK